MPASDPSIRVLTTPPSGCAEILEPAALQFLGALARRFEPERQRRLARRRERQQELDAGRLPDFLPETKEIRDRDWTVAPIRPDLTDRRVEITGPVERKMMINALNSGANVFMADFEDANAPTWENNLTGQQNVRDAVTRTIAYTSPEGKRYALEAKTATLVVRPRGWHLVEKHLTVDGQPISASLFDFGLTFFHTATKLAASGSGPYFYLPKLESHLEARLWNDVFVFAQDALGIPHGTIRATVLIETILAAFETDEILWELRDHSAGLHCGRWDYIFSYIKKLRRRPECVLPGRAPSDRAAAGRRSRHRARPARDPCRGHHRGGPVHDSQHRVAVPGGVARRHGLRAHQQPDGGRGDGGDLTRTGMAMAAPRRAFAGRSTDNCHYGATNHRRIGAGPTRTGRARGPRPR